MKSIKFVIPNLFLDICCFLSGDGSAEFCISIFSFPTNSSNVLNWVFSFLWTSEIHICRLLRVWVYEVVNLVTWSGFKFINSIGEIKGFTTGARLGLCEWVGMFRITYFKNRLERLRMIVPIRCVSK